MIVIHATAYFLKDKIAYFLWDTSQFVVPVFIFCSVYLFFKKNILINRKNIFPYIKKRFSRLLVPYYSFLFVFFLSMIFIGRTVPSLSYISQNIFLYGGLDLNWLPLLFIYITLLNPLIVFLKNKRLLFNTFFLISLLSSIIFIFVSTNYRWIMWLPWALLIFFTIYFVDNEKNNKKLIFIFTISVIIYVAAYYLESHIGHTLNHYTNKYPPTIYHISYGIFWTIFLYRLSEINLFKIMKIESILNFFSNYSYEIFFVHNLILYLFGWLKVSFSNWVLFFTVIVGLTVLVQIILNKTKITLFYIYCNILKKKLI